MSCTERTWCTMQPGTEHDQYHASDAVELAGSDSSLLAGWWAWLTEDRNGELRVVVEGHDGSEADVAAAKLARVLAATANPSAHDALVALLAAAQVEVPS